MPPDSHRAVLEVTLGLLRSASKCFGQVCMLPAYVFCLRTSPGAHGLRHPARTCYVLVCAQCQAVALGDLGRRICLIPGRAWASAARQPLLWCSHVFFCDGVWDLRVAANLSLPFSVLRPHNVWLGRLMPARVRTSNPAARISLGSHTPGSQSCAQLAIP